MNPRFLFFVVFLLLAGCLRLPQTRVLSNQSDFSCHLEDDGGLFVGWKSEFLEKERQPDIDLTSSWALSPSGHNYAFTAVERTYRSDEKSYWKDLTLFPREPETPQGKDSKKWTRGTWKIHIAFTKRIPREPIETDIAISTFFYNPIVHGPPN